MIYNADTDCLEFIASLEEVLAGLPEEVASGK